MKILIRVFSGVVEGEGQEKGSSHVVKESICVFFDFMNPLIDSLGTTNRTGHISTVQGLEEFVLW